MKEHLKQLKENTINREEVRKHLMDLVPQVISGKILTLPEIAQGARVEQFTAEGVLTEEYKILMSVVTNLRDLNGKKGIKELVKVGIAMPPRGEGEVKFYLLSQTRWLHQSGQLSAEYQSHPAKHAVNMMRGMRG